ncbi:thioesterase family protein [Acidisoma sp. L85]|uniref:acyl-CoA thioesterase n=1 Tax=Acidisoma sp. L85 TaxID=1641850 RepID=UPI00131D23DF|nr:thioesterase family protein [Acidisoma sp. L85]
MADRLVTEPDPTLRETYRLWGRETVRFSDTDALGHVNNVAYAAFLETGRTTFGLACGLPVGAAGTTIVLARVEIDYRAEVRWPAQLDIGVGLVALGRSSMALIQGIFQGERCVATGREVMVLLDTATRHSTPWPDRLREVLTEQALVAG